MTLPGKHKERKPPPIETRIKPGEVRNPTGANQYTWLHETGLKVLKEKNGLEKMMGKLKDMGLKGNVLASREIFDRVFGKAPQSLEVKSEHTFPQGIEVRFINSKKDGANE